MPKSGRRQKSSPTAQIIDFNKHKINQVIADMCKKYREDKEYFIPLVNHLQQTKPDVKPNEIQKELECFMQVKKIQRGLPKR